MRLLTTTIFSILLFSSFVSAAKPFYVLPNKEGVQVYKNEVRQMNEQAMEVVGKNDRLKVIETSRNNYKVKTDKGNIGWIEKRLASKTEGTVETFEDVEVQGYLDNPTPLYITDMDQGQSAPVDIDRSFKDALKRNADKETISRTQ